MRAETENRQLTLIHLTTVPQSLAFLRGQVGYMKAMGLHVEAISSPGLWLDSFGHDEEVPVMGIEMARRITPIADLMAVFRLACMFRWQRPAIVHAHTPKGGLLGMLSSFVARVPIRIYHIRGLPYMSATGKKRTMLKTTEWISSRLAHRVFCVSHSIRDVAIRDGICPADKIVVFGGGSGNGVDADVRYTPGRFSVADRLVARQRLGIDESVPVIGFVGRIVRDKGIHELAEAWQILRATYPTAHLVLTGPLEPQDPIDPSILQALQADERVHLLGHVDDSSAIYPVFDVLVLPTYREGFPNVPLEAAAMELPVVATAIPGCIDVVQDGVTGILVPVRDPDALRDAIARYLDNPDLRQCHGKAARKRVLRDFRQEAIWEELYDEYISLLKQRDIAAPVLPAVGYSPSVERGDSRE